MRINIRGIVGAATILLSTSGVGHAAQADMEKVISGFQSQST